MVLPVVKQDRGYLRLTYSGQVGVAGVGVTQTWDLTDFQEYIRADPMFKGSLIIFAKPGDGVSINDSIVGFVPVAPGVPEQLQLTLTSALITNTIELDIWCLHSVIGGLVDGPKLYIVGGAGAQDVRQFPGATRVAGQTLLAAATAAQSLVTIPIPVGVSRAFAITVLVTGREEAGPGVTQEVFIGAHRNAAGALVANVVADLNRTERFGIGVNTPALDGIVSAADSLTPTFDTTGLGAVAADWEYSISPPLLDPVWPVPPPVP